MFRNNQHTLKWIRLLGIAFLCSGSPLTAMTEVGDTLPEMADPSAKNITPEFERRLGKGFMRQIRQQIKLISDPEITSYLQSIGYRLVAASDTSQRFEFFMSDNPEINAIAAPGGIIGVNSGILLHAKTEAELAGVIAHEVAHITQRHLARMIEKHRQLNLPVLAAMLGAILVAVYNPQAAQAAILTSKGVGQESLINFTRHNEQEADRIGMQLLVRAGYDPNGLPDFFEKLQQSSRYQQRRPEFLSTHPLTVSRIADARARTNGYSWQIYTDSPGYALMRNKLIVHHAKTPADAVAYFKQEIGHMETPANRYGYALALTAVGDYNNAAQQLERLLQNDPDNITYLLAKARLFEAQLDYTNSLRIYQHAIILYPDYRPLVLAYARVLLSEDRPQEVRELLRHYAQIHAHDRQTYSLLGQAEGMLGHAVEVILLQAKFYHISGYTAQALDRLKSVQKQYKLEPYQQQQIEAHIAELEEDLAIDELLGI